ncbi:MAG: rod shape-determining protein MreC [Nitrospirae bacterium]|nr:rod shape-determining protein MreC [Nitrospirota bacterium]
MFKKRYVVLTVFAVLIAAILVFQSRIGKGRITDTPVYPIKTIEKVLSAATKGTGDFFRTYILPREGLEKRELNARLSKLQEESSKYIEAELENQRLRDLLGLKSQRPEFVTSAEVFARDPSNWHQVIWVNKGSDDGVEKEMIAVTPAGVVGRVHRIFNDSASVILLTDANSALAVRMQSTRAEGILEGRGGNICFLKYVPSEAEVEIGDAVISSGLDKIFPEGLVVGYVTELIKDEGGIFQAIKVAPSQDLNALEEVAILKR